MPTVPLQPPLSRKAQAGSDVSADFRRLAGRHPSAGSRHQTHAYPCRRLLGGLPDRQPFHPHGGRKEPARPVIAASNLSPRRQSQAIPASYGHGRRRRRDECPPELVLRACPISRFGVLAEAAWLCAVRVVVRARWLGLKAAWAYFSTLRRFGRAWVSRRGWHLSLTLSSDAVFPLDAQSIVGSGQRLA